VTHRKAAPKHQPDWMIAGLSHISDR